ncbi:CHAT domain-containing protein [Mastigocoleus sp. MO_188.B34]|uniref:CHAT domain-containing protein n=1 Tax=Mastigocoleus sp. MO_188.B34 TaxID=3036635 RepID=UPI00262E00F3|nr:CHAT domain-containing protein [Mastigocoleus sp. MO_188.B34]MDJ0698114.1 CHAT domain-containing protein [Mastigocoleus sp. MO_188.B34]
MPSLILAISRLQNTGTDNFAIWVVNAPYPSGNVLRDCVWPTSLNEVWGEWCQMFSGHSRLDLPRGLSSQNPDANPEPILPRGQRGSYSSRLMQHLGISLWRWVFEGNILASLEHSRGIANGKNTRLRFRLEIRDPDLIALPWETMQREAGRSPMSMSQNILFSRTTCNVEPLPILRKDPGLNILLVLGEDDDLQLEEEAKILSQTLAEGNTLGGNLSYINAPCMVKSLVQPTPQELISELKTGAYNVFFYAGHGLPDPDGGLLLLGPDSTFNGMELAQALSRTGVKLAVFNACWGAQPAAIDRQAVPYSSLAEVMIRQGVPAVLGMRDKIADHESHTFIQAFSQAIRARKPIDEAVADARKQLLTIYKFNQPAWTLPVLYLHPDFNGELIQTFEEGNTELPETSLPGFASQSHVACLRPTSGNGKTWKLRPVITRIGRTIENDIVIPAPSVSKHHAEILCRNIFNGSQPVRTYYLQEKSTYGTTWILRSSGWQQIHRQEVTLEPGTQLKFGSTRSHPWEFVIEDS